MEVVMCENKKTCVCVTAAISALLVVAAATLFIYQQNDKKKIGGRQIKVNYKFSKEFDD